MWLFWLLVCCYICISHTLSHMYEIFLLVWNLCFFLKDIFDEQTLVLMKSNLFSYMLVFYGFCLRNLCLFQCHKYIILCSFEKHYNFTLGCYLSQVNFCIWFDIRVKVNVFPMYLSNFLYYLLKRFSVPPLNHFNTII